MTYPETLRYLEGLGRFGIRPGLETIRALSEALGRPEMRLRFVHVAGTNGKGSTCAFLEAMCREAGLRVGLYTSPHLVSFRERIQVHREWIPEEAVVSWVERIREILGGESLGKRIEATFFEVVTAVALAWFEQQSCDVVIWETGLGGRWDATNLVVPTVSAITNIGWDHMQWLGNTLEAIAREKAGIFKRGVPAVTTEEQPAVLQVLQEEAAAVGTNLRVVGPESPEWEVCRRGPLALRGAHQLRNAALALAALNAGGWDDRVNESARTRGLAGAVWPGRFQELRIEGRTVVLDGAHNAPGFEVLDRTMGLEYPGRAFGLMVGMLAEKESGDALIRLAHRATRVVVVRVHSLRAGDPADLAGRLLAAAPGRRVTTAESLREGLAFLGEEPLVLVTGSLYLVGEALSLWGGETRNERRLNDWSPIR